MTTEDTPTSWLREAMALHRDNRLDEAARLYEAVLEWNPAQFDALHLLGVIAAQAGDQQRAVDLIGKALAVEPRHAAAHRNMGLALRELDRTDEAMACFERAVALKPEYGEAWINLGNALRDLGQFERALECYDRAVALNERFAEAHYNRAHVLLDLRRLEAALAAYDRALLLNPKYVEAWNNRGKILKELGRLDEAIECWERAIALRPKHANAHWNKGLTLLLTGRYEEGWPLYEWGWASGERGIRRMFPQPLWLGEEPIAGKRILLHAEQGLGDNIQFCRYAALVAGLGAEVILEVPLRLLPLFRNLEGPAQLIPYGAEPPPFDVHCPLLSLPLALKTALGSVPSRGAYLRAELDKVLEWQDRLGPRTRPRIGLTWSSTSNYRDDAKRSMALAEFLKALPEEGFDWICLQKEIKESDRATLAARPDIRVYCDEQRDFADAAALVECMDLVVSTCTSVPHLAAALGKPTWILLSWIPDWRWLLRREDSPWYPTVKLYRQQRADDWSKALARVRLDLELLWGNVGA